MLLFLKKKNCSHLENCHYYTFLTKNCSFHSLTNIAIMNFEKISKGIDVTDSIVNLFSCGNTSYFYPNLSHVVLIKYVFIISKSRTKINTIERPLSTPNQNKINVSILETSQNIRFPPIKKKKSDDKKKCAIECEKSWVWMATCDKTFGLARNQITTNKQVNKFPSSQLNTIPRMCDQIKLLKLPKKQKLKQKYKKWNQPLVITKRNFVTYINSDNQLKSFSTKRKKVET